MDADDRARERGFCLKIFLAGAKLFLRERRDRERKHFNAPLLPALAALEIGFQGRSPSFDMGAEGFVIREIQSQSAPEECPRREQWLR